MRVLLRLAIILHLAPATFFCSLPTSEAARSRPITVSVALTGTDIESGLLEAAEEHLRVELAAQRLDLLPANAANREPNLRISLALVTGEDGTTSVVIQLGDAVVGKRVSRTVDLRDVSPDARPLLIAASVAELIRASWSELVLVKPIAGRKAEPSATKPGQPSASSVPVSSADDARAWLDLAGITELFREQTNVGLKLRLSIHFAPRWVLFSQLQGGEALSRRSAHGRVSGRYGSAAVGASVDLWIWSDLFRLQVETAATGQWINYQVDANISGVASPTSEYAVGAHAGLGTQVTFGRWYLVLGGAGLATLRPATAKDAGSVVLSNQGLGLAAWFGLGARI